MSYKAERILRNKKAHYVTNSSHTDWNHIQYDWSGYSVQLHLLSHWTQLYADSEFSALKEVSNGSTTYWAFENSKKIMITGRFRTYYNSGQDLKFRVVPYYKTGTQTYWPATNIKINNLIAYKNFNTHQEKSSANAADNYSEVKTYIETPATGKFLIGTQLTYREGSWTNSSFPSGDGVHELLFEEIG